MPTEEKQLSQDFRALKELLKWDFYKRLLQGELAGAKRTANFLVKLVQQLPVRVAEAAETYSAIDTEKTQTLTRTWSLFQGRFAEFRSTVEGIMQQVTSEEFMKEPATWTSLFKAELRDLVNDLIDLLAVLERFSKALERSAQEEKLVPFKYTPAYAELKQRAAAELVKRADAAERKVRVFLSQKPPLLFQKKVTDRMDFEPWKGHFHSWIAAPYDDYRLVYTWDGKTVLFETIARHKELGLKGRT